jgi:hypothetical protein
VTATWSEGFSFPFLNSLSAHRYDKLTDPRCSSMTGELVAEVWEDISRTAVLAVGGGKNGADNGSGGLSEGGCRVM